MAARSTGSRRPCVPAGHADARAGRCPAQVRPAGSPMSRCIDAFGRGPRAAGALSGPRPERTPASGRGHLTGAVARSERTPAADRDGRPGRFLGPSARPQRAGERRPGPLRPSARPHWTEGPFTRVVADHRGSPDTVPDPHPMRPGSRTAPDNAGQRRTGRSSFQTFHRRSPARCRIVTGDNKLGRPDVLCRRSLREYVAGHNNRRSPTSGAAAAHPGTTSNDAEGPGRPRATAPPEPFPTPRQEIGLCAKVSPPSQPSDSWRRWA